MKTSVLTRTLALTGVTALSLAFAPLGNAQNSQNNQNPNPQTNPPTDTKVDDSTAGNSTTTGAPTSQPNTIDQSNSKDLNGSLDKNPSTTSTDSAPTSATKTPSDASTPPDQTAPQTASSSSTRSNQVSDKDFLIKAAQGGMTEVQLGQLAQEKAASPDVKQFGARMVADHSKANAQLKTVADKEGVTVPTQLDSRHQAMVDHLQRLSGPAFDKAYVNMMVRDHEKDAAEFRNASANAQDPDVKAFASDTLKVIESHLSDIKSIQNSQK
jgi:putative membrane protein